MLRSVLTTARPPEGTVVLSAEDKSNPADCGEPRVGKVACSLRNLTWRQEFMLWLLLLSPMEEEEEE